MARFTIDEAENGAISAGAQTDMLLKLGVMYASGRDCDVDLVAAHKWLNIAAIKGSAKAARMRADLAAIMPKCDIARALREAREWMTMH